MISSLNLGLIGNGRIGALIDENAEIVWACLPRFDGDPVFCSLLKEHPTGEGSGYIARSSLSTWPPPSSPTFPTRPYLSRG